MGTRLGGGAIRGRITRAVLGLVTSGAVALSLTATPDSPALAAVASRTGAQPVTATAGGTAHGTAHGTASYLVRTRPGGGRV